MGLVSTSARLQLQAPRLCCLTLTDNSSNIKKTFNFFDGGFCCLHTLELVVRQFMRNESVQTNESFVQREVCCEVKSTIWIGACSRYVKCGPRISKLLRLKKIMLKNWNDRWRESLRGSIFRWGWLWETDVSAQWVGQDNSQIFTISNTGWSALGVAFGKTNPVYLEWQRQSGRNFWLLEWKTVRTHSCEVNVSRCR